MACDDQNCSNNNCQCSHAACECHPVYPQNNPCNDEFWDGTDGACPAWWRGADDGVDVIIKGINRALDRFDKADYSEYGPFGHDDINKLVARLKKLYVKVNNENP